MAAERALEELEIKHAMELESQALKVQDAQAQVDAASKGWPWTRSCMGWAQ